MTYVMCYFCSQPVIYKASFEKYFRVSNKKKRSGYVHDPVF